jgi:hypothetical protein
VAGTALLRRRAHLGGRSVGGTIQAILARRQLEQGDRLSQRTFRLLQVTQLRSFAVGAAEGAVEPAWISAPVSENVAKGACDMLDLARAMSACWLCSAVLLVCMAEQSRRDIVLWWRQSLEVLSSSLNFGGGASPNR